MKSWLLPSGEEAPDVSPLDHASSADKKATGQKPVLHHNHHLDPAQGVAKRDTGESTVPPQGASQEAKGWWYLEERVILPETRADSFLSQPLPQETSSRLPSKDSCLPRDRCCLLPSLGEACISAFYP
ncbi:PREDICTED: uncharacterized protein LOC105987391 isoform X2 [Dipodomys ordii]|uniref:Uncharacterized protein LOC105987391 isoform X2 n=1 Tax=Dipodomys ordii TaxID=10020 RepID=A0A1S3FC72_DIPOR|nr:PREDICTED: uncharacterized protein LOC105987391 isoform X2 [Dipodomys ordii]